MRVLAIRNSEEKTLYVYGEGVLLENKIPDTEPFNEVRLTNPCILLDNGKYVWGFQCWWGELEKTKKRFSHCENIETVEVEEEIKPVSK